MRAMPTQADCIIDALGGTTAVARLTETPLSTVHSWRRNGIPASRLAHLKLAAHAAGMAVDVDQIATAPRSPQQAAA